MTKSEKIRALALKGLSTAEIARRLVVSYQHAYNVLRQSGLKSINHYYDSTTKKYSKKPVLTQDALLEAGFENVAEWRLSEKSGIEPSVGLPARQGVYAFAMRGVVHYVGVATIGLSKRMHSYVKPGPSQRTSIRLNRMISDCIVRDESVSILIATPDDLHWNGLPINACAGLELGLIKKFELPWNLRSAR